VKKSLLDRYVSAKFIVGMVVEFPILIGGGILGLIFSWSRLPLYPLPNLLGLVLLITGYIIHLGYAHKEFKKSEIKAHRCLEEPKKLVTSGIYSKIRHPGYLGLILIYFGLALIFGIVWMLIPAAVFTVLTYLTAKKEEEFLEQEFGREYQEYMNQVPWRFIPKII
jgi:protein-S-isoprenylcysteine O-methyltransferase Ste14